MDSQKFCLKWDGFQGSVTSVFDDLRVDSELVDVTLCCEGQRVRAHRMMLSACSPYFRELFKDLPCQQLAVFLKDTSAADLTAIVEFMYKGKVNVSQGQLASFIKTAEMLQIRGLSGEEDKGPPPSRHTTTPRPTAPSGRQMAPPSPAARRHPEPSLPPPPPPRPPSQQHHHQHHHQQPHHHQQKTPASPPTKRRRVSEPIVCSESSLPPPSPSGATTPSASPRSASLPSPGASASSAVQASAVQRSQSAPHESSKDAVHDDQLEQKYDDPIQDYGDGEQEQHDEGTQEGYPQQHDIQQDHDVPQNQQGPNSGSGTSAVKIEKVDLTDDDDMSLGDTLDHVAELERYAVDGHAASPAVQGQLHGQQLMQQHQQRVNFATAMARQMGSAPGPSQRLSEDGNSTAHGRRYTCETCGQHYHHPVSLKLHRKAHEGLTTCQFCGRTLSMVASLRAHLRTVHGLSEEEMRRMVPTARRRRQARFGPVVDGVGGDDSMSQ